MPRVQARGLLLLPRSAPVLASRPIFCQKRRRRSVVDCHPRLPSSSAASTTLPPSPPPRPRRLLPTQHKDPYAWMEQPTAEVLVHLDAENRYSSAAMAATHPFQDRLYHEMVEGQEVNGKENEEAQKKVCIKLAESAGDGYIYYSRRPPRCNFPVYYRRHDQTQEESVLLNQNAFPDYYQRMTLGDIKVSSWQQDLVAFTLAEPDAMTEGYTLYLRDVQTGEWWTADEDAWAGIGSFEWGNAIVPTASRSPDKGALALYYTKLDEEHGRPHELWVSFLSIKAKKAGRLVRRPQLLYTLPKDAQAFFLSLSRTKDRQYITMNSTSKSSSEVHLLPGPAAATETPSRSSSPAGIEAMTTPKLFRKRRGGIQYFVDHGDGTFFIVTNEGEEANEKGAVPQEEYRLMTCTIKDTNRWTPYNSRGQESTDSSSIEDIDLFRDYCVLYQRYDGIPSLYILDRQHKVQGSGHRPCLPAEVETSRLQPGLNQVYTAHTVRFSITSPILPDVTYEYDMQQGQLSELHREHLPGRPPLVLGTEISGGDYCCRRVLVKAGEDGVHIPMTLAYRDGEKEKAATEEEGTGHRQRPVLLQGYGAYGVSLDLGYRPEYLPLLNRGCVIAFAHVRGGGEYGRQWHAMGKREHKMNSILDYLQCAQWIIREGWTSPGGIVGYGASAGALMVAGAVHRQPELFGAMILKVPFLDLVRTMTDPSLSLTVHEYDEWGNPQESCAVLERLKALSPYETLPTGTSTTTSTTTSFPPTLVFASLADTRVRYWEAAKYVAKARDATHGKAEILLRMEGGRGHEGPPSQSEIFQEAAYEYAFMLSRLGLVEDKQDMKSKIVRTRSRKRLPQLRYLREVPPLAFW